MCSVQDSKFSIIQKGLRNKMEKYLRLNEKRGRKKKRFPEDEQIKSVPVLIIGDFNVFEVDCRSEALKIGEDNIVESKSFVGRGVELTNGCIVGAGCRLTNTEVIPEKTVIFGANCSRRQQYDRPPPQTSQLEFLAQVLPRYHLIKKAKRQIRT